LKYNHSKGFSLSHHNAFICSLCFSASARHSPWPFPIFILDEGAILDDGIIGVLIANALFSLKLDEINTLAS